MPGNTANRVQDQFEGKGKRTCKYFSSCKPGLISILYRMGIMLFFSHHVWPNRSAMWIKAFMYVTVK